MKFAFVLYGLSEDEIKVVEKKGGVELWIISITVKN